MEMFTSWRRLPRAPKYGTRVAFEFLVRWKRQLTVHIVSEPNWRKCADRFEACRSKLL